MIALLFAKSRVIELPTQRYFYPLFDGMPGGFLEYDYRENPCGFASIHFGGMNDHKPDDRAMLYLAPAILGRRAARSRGLAPTLAREPALLAVAGS